MTLLLITLLATTAVSGFSLAGALGVTWLAKKWPGLIMSLVSLSAGTLLGAAFFHLLPESLETVGIEVGLGITLGSYLLFFLVERILHVQHCHTENCPSHTVGYLNLLGDAIHNFIDGLVIAAAFSTSIELGIATTLAVAIHEIPQEWGDMGVLLHAGMSVKTALLANLGVALTAVAGGIIGVALSSYSTVSASYLLPVAAGGFLYIASSDLVPELRRANKGAQGTAVWLSLLIGVAIMILTAHSE